LKVRHISEEALFHLKRFANGPGSLPDISELACFATARLTSGMRAQRAFAQNELHLPTQAKHSGVGAITHAAKPAPSPRSVLHSREHLEVRIVER
jgi:hypothetical protein